MCGRPLATPAEKSLGRHEFCASDVDEELFARLRAWRKDVAAEAQVPAYVIFSDATLLAIAEQLPTDEAALLSVSGVGPSKMEKFGAEILNLVSSHVAG